MKRKIIVMLIVVCYVVVLMAGCVTNNVPAGTVTTGLTQQTKAEKKENFNPTGYPIVDEKITIRSMYTTHPLYGKPEDLELFQALEEITNIHIDWDIIEGEQMELYFAAGDFPDTFIAGLNQDRISMYGVEGGKFFDLRDTIKEYMPNLQKAYKDFPLAEKIITQINGEIYTLPRLARPSTAAGGKIHYRTDHFEQTGLPMPKTTDEFYDVLRAIKDKGITQGYAPLLSIRVNFFNAQMEPFFFGAFGDSIDLDFADDGNGNVIFNRTSEQYKNYLKYINKLYQEDLFDNEYLTMDQATASVRYKGGQASVSDGMTDLVESDFEDGIIHMDVLPALVSEYTNTQKVKAVDYVQTRGGAISKDSKYLKEIARMYDIWFSREEVVAGSGIFGQSFEKGIYGRHWQFTDYEHTKYVQLVPDWWESSASNYLYMHVRWERDIGLIDDMMVGGDGNSLIRQMGYVKYNIPFAVDPFPANFIKFKEEEQSIIDSKYADIQSYVTQMRGKFIAGIEPIDATWDEYCATIEKMGIDDVIKAYQSGYDRFMK